MGTHHAHSRLLLRLGDGSLVKLGENGWLQIAELAQRRAKNFLSATLKVFAGAFRFTIAPESGTESEVTVQFATLIARLNAADIWGKKLGDREVLVLINGKVSVASDIPSQEERLLVIRFADADGVNFHYLLAMIDDAFQSRPDTIVVPGAKMEFAMQLIMTPLVQDLVGKSRKPTSPRPSP